MSSGLPVLGSHLAFGLPASIATPSTVLREGWILKKRRKKMQGFARRYFVLYQSGLLVYSFEPGQPVRDQISLPQAAISTAPGRKDIHIDSNMGTFHLKCENTVEYSAWMATFRKFVASGAETRRSMAASLRHVSRQGSIHLNKTGTIAEAMGTTISELDDSFVALKDDYLSKDMSVKCERTVKSGKGDKDKTRDGHGASVFGLLKKSRGQPQANVETSSTSGDTENFQIAAQRIQAAIDSLKSQHSSLLTALHQMSLLEVTSQLQNKLPLTKEEEEFSSEPEPMSLRDYLPSPHSQRHSKRTSMATSVSESLNEWFDAWDGEPGAQEFVLDADDITEAPEQPSRLLSSDSSSTLGEGEDDSSVDTDIEESSQNKTSQPLKKTPSTRQLQRRTKLPAPVTGDEGSLFAVLKKNVGKDLSTIAFPVTFNEPLTLLQRAAEEVEYYDLLDKAAASNDPVERLAYIAAFAVSGYAHTRYRSSRKGFNPMLGETFEDDRVKFIAEKTRHNPVEMAYHAEGAGWNLTATSAGRTKFWGKSLEIIPLGTTYLECGGSQYQWKKPSSFMRNLMYGTKYLEHCGNMAIENKTDRSKCVLEFKQGSYWGSGSNAVVGTIQSSNGQVLSHIEGKWDDQISLTLDSSNFRVLWRANPPPRNAEDYYGFTSFGITLNEVAGEMANQLPPTDSRWRPDVRALEEGDLDRAEAEKLRVEEMQRERRRQGTDAQPRWFRKEGDDWKYVGGYWETRESGWKEILPLW